MNNTTKIILAVVAVAVIAVAVVLLMGKDSGDKNPATSPSGGNQSSDTGDETVAATIVYDDNGFSPSTLTVKAGDKIKITNQSQKEMEFASNVHPVHTDNSELNVGDIAPGASKTFAITTKGTWNYHDHYNASKGGTITVE